MSVEKEAARPNSRQPIRVDEVYTLADFQKRTGLGRAGIRAARRRGLPVRQCGRNRYVSGADWAEFLRARAGSRQTASTTA
jgi:hypothetical protein